MPFCTKCGNEVANTDTFCNKCGTSIQEIPAEGAGTKVNQVAYAVLAILLGGLGIHKFYAGKIGMGILYILFCWTAIPGIIGLIEGIIAVTKKADANGNIYI